MNSETDGEKMLELLDAELKRLPVQKPGAAFKAGLMAKLEPVTEKPVKVSDLVLACAVLMAPVLAASALQFAATGSLGPSILSRLEELTALTASVPVLDSLRVALFASGYAVHSQFITYSLAAITLALVGQLKPHNARR